MAPPADPIPEGFHTVTPYLTIQGASELLEFLKRAFGAVEAECMRDDAGRVTPAPGVIGGANGRRGGCPGGR